MSKTSLNYFMALRCAAYQAPMFLQAHSCWRYVIWTKTETQFTLQIYDTHLHLPLTSAIGCGHTNAHHYICKTQTIFTNETRTSFPATATCNACDAANIQTEPLKMHRYQSTKAFNLYFFMHQHEPRVIPNNWEDLSSAGTQ